MDRRDFIKSVGVAGGVAAGLSTMVGGVAGQEASAARAGEGNSPSAARNAMHALLDTIREVEGTYLSSAKGVTTVDDIAEGQRAIAHMLETALYFWLEADPERPVFKPYVTPTRKLLGDNPDSIYFFAPIRGDRSYRVTGNVGASTFTSFTIEAGSSEGHVARRSVAALSDEDMEIGPDGNYEIILSAKKPARGNWLKLEADAGQVTTRHYHETSHPIAASAAWSLPIRIEALDPAPPADYGGDSEVADHLTWVANFVREHAMLAMSGTTPEMAKKLGWLSLKPNRFTKPGQWVSASGDNAYGNTHAYYAQAPYELEPDEALLIRGRFPDCRFANVVLWNRFMQSYDYQNRSVSLNRKQVHYEKDGSFRIVIAHEDPGVPNWLDTEGRRSGRVYWRYVFPVEAPERVKTKVVKLASLK